MVHSRVKFNKNWNASDDIVAPKAVTVPRTPDECRKSAHFEHYSSCYDTIDNINTSTVAVKMTEATS